MTKISQLDRAKMVQHLREISKLSQLNNAKHSRNIQKQMDHIIKLSKFMEEDRAEILKLKMLVDIKQREIDELNSKQMDLLWDLAKLEKENITMKNEIKEDEIRAAEVQKRLTKHFKEESTDN